MSFAWIGAFRSGGLTPEFEKNFPGLDRRRQCATALLWITCGTDDGLNRYQPKFPRLAGPRTFIHADIETPGEHTWLVWGGIWRNLPRCYSH